MWKNEFTSYINPSKSNFPYIVMGNKEDLEDARKVAREEVLQWCKENGNLEYFETSAKTSLRVKEAFEDIANKAVLNKSEQV